MGRTVNEVGMRNLKAAAVAVGRTVVVELGTAGAMRNSDRRRFVDRFRSRACF